MLPDKAPVKAEKLAVLFATAATGKEAPLLKKALPGLMVPADAGWRWGFPLRRALRSVQP